MNYLIILLALTTFVFQQLQACTGLKLKAKDGSQVNGRTFEFGVKVDTLVAVVPRGYSFQGTTALGPGLSYKAQYGAVGTTTPGPVALLDGMNEKGLCVGTFFFPGYAGYSQITPDNQKKALSPVQFPHWIVTNFATVPEVKEALDRVVIAPVVDKAWGPTPPPFHYIVYDKSGKCLVIEPMEGKLVAYDNPIGVFTNSPNFEWHMTNLRNFINLTPINVKPLVADGVLLAPFGQGSGMVGLPGDFTPPSRFVRAAIYSLTAFPSDDAEEAVMQAFHILNQFDIPVGVVRMKEPNLTAFDYTLLTRVSNPNSLKYYYRTFDDQTIRFVDLNAFDLNAKAIKQLDTDKSSHQAVDMSSELE